MVFAMRTLTIALLVAGSPAVWAQAPAELPGCEPRPEVRQAIQEKLSAKSLANMKFAERAAFRRQVLEELTAKYPREAEPYRLLFQAAKEDDIGHYPALVDRYQKQAEQAPDDPLAQYLAGLALSGRDTAVSIQLLEQARAHDPDFAWPALELAHIYGPGTKRNDKKKAEEAISAFFKACPSSTDEQAQRLLGRAGTTELQKRVAEALRARLTNESDPRRLRAYETLWALEFRTHPPEEQDAVRKQVAADLERLAPLQEKPDAEWSSS